MNDSESLISGYINQFMEKVYYFCLRKTDSAVEAEDLSSDIALAIFSELRRGVAPDNFAAWVWKIARNHYSKWADKKHRESQSLSKNTEDFDIAEEKSLSDSLVHEEDLALLRRELAFIAAEYRKVVVPYYIEDKSIREIAASLSLSEGAVKTRLFRARQYLKEGMNMARTFGKMSYLPEKLGFTMNGLSGNNGEPWCFLRRSFDKNILLAAYRSPSTAEDLALELGVALPYMEEELETLVDATLLTKDNDRYETNFYILSAAAQEKIHREHRRIAPELTKALIDFYRQKTAWLDTNCPGWRSADQSEEDMRWAGLMEVLDAANSQTIRACHKNRGERKTEGIGDWGHTVRPNGGEWDVIGYEDYPEMPSGTSLCGCVDVPEARNLPEIRFTHYTFRILGGQYFNQAVTYREGQNLQAIAEGREDKTDAAILDGLIQKGFLKREDGILHPAFCVIRSEKTKPQQERMKEQIGDKMDAIVQMIQPFYNYVFECAAAEIPRFLKNKEYNIDSVAASILWGRGVIVEEAIKQGYLIVPEDDARKRMLGAAIVI